MTFQYKMATSAGRGVASVGRRCRTTLPVARPLIHQSLRSHHQTVLPASAVISQRSTPSASQSATPRAAASVVQAFGEAYTHPTVATSISRAAMTRCVEHRGMMGVIAAEGGRRGLNIDRHGFGTVRGFSTAPAEGGNAKEESGDVTDGVGDEVAPSDDQGKGEKGSDTPASEEAASVDEEGADVSKDKYNPLENLPDDDGDPGPPPPVDPSIVTEPPPKVLEIVEAIDSLNFIELAMLIDVFKEKLGIDEVPSLSFGDEEGGEGEKGGDAGAGAAVEKTIFKLKVTGFNDKAKIKVIKEIRAITGLGLREAKELVENLPQVVKEDLKAEDAESLKATLEGVGATVELE